MRRVGPYSRAQDSFRKGCLNCHLIRVTAAGAVPILPRSATASEHDIVIRIVNGGVNMPAYGNSIKPEELARITAFMESRKQHVPGASVGATENK